MNDYMKNHYLQKNKTLIEAVDKIFSLCKDEEAQKLFENIILVDKHLDFDIYVDSRKKYVAMKKHGNLVVFVFSTLKGMDEKILKFKSNPIVGECSDYSAILSRERQI